MLALILDIGTTTIKGLLLNKTNRREIASDFILNGQVKFGDDVITRIEFSLKSEKNKELLRLAAVKSINELIKRLTDKTSFKPSAIKEAIIVCNTAMHHLFLGISAEPLIKPPYKTLEKPETKITARNTGLNIHKEATVTILPNIGGFVGSDALGFIIASSVYNSSSIKLGIDIGTNGEIILGSSDKILVTSTAAGPAFEGMDKDISGSELIDAVAEMLKRGIIDKTGRMKKKNYPLYKKGNKTISITQTDIRKIQLAKAAIYAGIKILMRHLDIKTSGISRLLLTGSFGNSINAKNAISIGLIPKISVLKVRFIKNAPLMGAKEYILSKDIQKELSSILSKVKRIPLVRKDFQETYADSMGF